MPSTLLDTGPTTRRYAPRTAVDTVDLHLDAGSRIGLIGARKSTVLRIPGRLSKLAARVLSPSQRRLSGDQVPAARRAIGQPDTCFQTNALRDTSRATHPQRAERRSPRKRGSASELSNASTTRTDKVVGRLSHKRCPLKILSCLR